MSWQMVQYVRDTLQVSSPVKDFLLLVSTYCHPKNNLAWPTQQTLAARKGCTINWIHKLTKRALAEVPQFRVHRQRTARGRLRLYYEIVPPTPPPHTCPGGQHDWRQGRKEKERKPPLFSSGSLGTREERVKGARLLGISPDSERYTWATEPP